MIPIKQKLTRKGLGFSAGEWRPLLKSGWGKVGRFWHRVILRKHFTVAGASEYGYQRRSKGHETRKLRKYGHRRPLVFTGDLERQVSRVVDVRASSKGARVVLHGPRYLWQYRKDYGQPNKAAELQTVSKRDAKLLAEVLDEHIRQEANRGTGTVDITGGHRAA